MKKPEYYLFVMFVLLLSACKPVRITKNGYRIKGEVSQTILSDRKLKGMSKISGWVYSRDDSTFLSAANIFVTENFGTTSNNEGEFELVLAPGVYNVKASYVGHDDLKIPDLDLLPNQLAILIFELGTTALY